MPLLEVKNLHTYFHTKKGTVKAVNDVTYSVEPGKTIGIVGESGSGKSVSAMSIIQLLDSNGYIAGGEVLFDTGDGIIDLTKLPLSEMNKIRGNAISVIFQEPMTSLNPVFSVEKQLSEPFIIHQGMDKKQAAEQAVKMLYDVQIPNPEAVMKQYPHQLSGGMRQRVMIAMALACRPKILIADEPTTALDVTIQAQILALLRDVTRAEGRALLLITHDLGVIWEMCTRVVVMYASRVMEEAPVDELFRNPAHPYTRGLMRSIPGLQRDAARLYSIPGAVPSLIHPPAGCPFAPRCPHATQECRERLPEWRELSPGHFAACHHPQSGPP
jgi:peptide/nickel transport system ATP-binding protein